MDDPHDIASLMEDFNQFNKRDHTARLLSKLGDLRAVEPLIEALKYPEKRDAAAYTLGELGDPRAVEPLIAAYHTALTGGDPTKALAPLWADSSGTARDMIIQALAKIGDHRATETLLAALNDPGLYIQRSAYRGLGKLGDPRAIEPLLKRLLEDQDMDAVEPLLELGGSQTLESLSYVLASPEYPVYLRIAVARQFQERALPMPDILFHNIQYSETPQERREIIKILGNSADPRAFPILISILENPQEEILTHQDVIQVFYIFNNDESVEPLLLFMKDNPSRILRAFAAQAFICVDTSEVTAALCEALHDKAAIVRAAAATSLTLRDDPQIIPALEAMIARETFLDDNLQEFHQDQHDYFENDYLSNYVRPADCAQESINTIRAYYD